MTVTVSFPSVPVIWAVTMSPTFTPLMSLTLPVTLVAGVTAAVTYRPGLPSVIDVALTAATLPPIASRSAWPRPGVGIAPLPG